MPRTTEDRKYHYCFTLNNYTEDEYNKIIEAAERSTKYWIIGKEVGDSGTPHLQGYFSLRRCGNLRHVRNLFGPRIHFEVARGTARQNRQYCVKDGDFREGGNIPSEPKQAKADRDTIARAFRDAIRSGNDGMAQFSDEYAGAYYFSGHNLLRNHLALCRPEPRPDINVIWIYGAPGVGKSREAHGKMPEAYIKEPRTKWWNGYIMEKDVIIDDFGPGGIDINHLLRWFDRYKCMVETKGGMVPLLACNFILTSNFEPSECWKDKDGVPHPQMDALYRRITLQHME